jgi:plasmid stabilization system protein ParE
MPNSTVKEEARRLIEKLPEDATWEDLQYEIYVRQAIEAGLKDSREGRTVPLEEARRRFGLGTPAYIGRHSSQYARGMVERIFDRSELLASQPFLGGVVQESDDDSLRELFEHPYRIIYRVLEDRIDVVAVIHSSRRLPRGL